MKRILIFVAALLSVAAVAQAGVSVSPQVSVMIDGTYDAAGDLLVGTADNTAGRLAIGADNTVLQSNGTTAEWVTNLDVAGDILATGSDVSVGAAGVKLTGDGDGAITLLGLGNGSNEDLTINLDDTANTAVVSSSTGVTSVSFTGIAVDAPPLVTNSTDATITVSGNVGFYTNADDDAIQFNLPAAAANKHYCFRNLFAKAITINPDDADYIQLGGTKAAAGEAIVSTGAATEYICLLGIDASNWVSMQSVGTWAEESP